MIRKGIKVENSDFKLIYLADSLTCSLHHKGSDVIQFLTAHKLIINAQGFKLKKGKKEGYCFKRIRKVRRDKQVIQTLKRETSIETGYKLW